MWDKDMSMIEFAFFEAVRKKSSVTIRIDAVDRIKPLEFLWQRMMWDYEWLMDLHRCLEAKGDERSYIGKWR